MKYYIEVASINKAKRDIDEICRKEGFVNLTRRNFGKGGVGRFLTKVCAVFSILFFLKKGDILLLQYPMKKFYKIACRFARLKGACVVTIIHDLGAFRRKKLTVEQENKRLSLTDFLIVHNPTMRDHLLKHGFKGGVHCLQIFDYLSDREPALYDTPHSPWKVVYAGSLGQWRSGFLYKLGDIDVNYDIELYGDAFEEAENRCKTLSYKGFMPSDDFISTISADFGLVWDGDSLAECNGAWGEYLKINNPHKTSFYLRAAVPVIVWSKAAMAPFVREKNLGIVVDSLEELGERMHSLSLADYAKMKEAARSISVRLNNGYYFNEGIKAAQEFLSKRAAE